MLSTEEASKAVFDGENGMLSAVSPGKVIVDCATLSPERMKFIEEKIKAAGGTVIQLHTHTQTLTPFLVSINNR